MEPEKLYHVPDKDIDGVLDKLFYYIDESFLAGKFDEIDEFLEKLDISQIDETLLIGILTVCFSAQDKLKNYASFYEKVKQVVEKRLLVGLEPLEDLSA